MKYVVISPGSRSAPLVIAFNRQAGIECLSIVDERSAAFFALGMAQQLQAPVGLLCTSGSAVLNYAPAIAEAYYQKIPLIVFTADRPWEAIDQGENQSIVQFDIYKNYIKKSFELPVDCHHQKDLMYSDRLVNEAFNIATAMDKGPVHINIPLREPLYDIVDYTMPIEPKIIQQSQLKYSISQVDEIRLLNQWNQSKKKMILVGSMPQNAPLERLLERIVSETDTVVLTENISNMRSTHFIPALDPMIECIDKMDLEDCIPDLLITIGAGLISKKVKMLLRKKSLKAHWHISASHEHWDNFNALTEVIQADYTSIFELFLKEKLESNYTVLFQKINGQINQFNEKFMASLPFSDFVVYKILNDSFPPQAHIQWGNSTPIRYANLLENKDKSIAHFANRGISGIDGVVSTAAGASYVYQQGLTICITGDISFFYDSNAWWNRYLGGNFKCILINNAGGNIFKIIPGPDKNADVLDFFETPNNMDARHIAAQFDIDYIKVENELEMKAQLPVFLSKNNSRASILEIKTAASSSHFLRQYFEELAKCKMAD